LKVNISEIHPSIIMISYSIISYMAWGPIQF
jgi:hypothetical protein